MIMFVRVSADSTNPIWEVVDSLHTHTSLNFNSGIDSIKDTVIFSYDKSGIEFNYVDHTVAVKVLVKQTLKRNHQDFYEQVDISQDGKYRHIYILHQPKSNFDSIPLSSCYYLLWKKLFKNK
jgi:hypothetical protein